MKRLLLGCIALVIALSLGYSAYTGVRTDTIPTPPNHAVVSSDPQTHLIREKTDAYEIDIEYNHVDIPEVDTQVDARIAQVIEAFRSDVRSFGSHPDNRTYQLTGEMAELYAGDAYVSQRINMYQDMGGAHGLPIVITQNFSLPDAQPVTLEEALSLIGLTLGEVAARSLEQLRRDYGNSVFAEGTAPTEENYATFLVTPSSVVFIFQAYQVVPYAAGMPEIRFERIR